MQAQPDMPESDMADDNMKQQGTGHQVLIAIGVLVIAAALGLGALQIRSDSGYTGVGPAFLPWVVALALGLCGFNLLYEALSGGYRHLEDETDGATPHWGCAAWVSLGLLLNAALITRVGFVVSCTLLFVLAARGFRSSLGQAATAGQWGRDALTGLCLSAPTYWLFTKGLGLTLPGLTATGWI